VLATWPGRTQGFEADFARQFLGRRGETRTTEEPVLAGMPRPVRAGAGPLQRARPVTHQPLGLLTLQRQQYRTQGAAPRPLFLFEYPYRHTKALRFGL